MRKFEVTFWPDKSNITIEVHFDSIADLHRLEVSEATELLKCLQHLLNNGSCEHEYVHRIDSYTKDRFLLMLPTSDRHTKAYTVSKSKLTELKIGLMSVING